MVILPHIQLNRAGSMNIYNIIYLINLEEIQMKRTTLYTLLFILLATVLILSGCGQKPEEDGQSLGSGGSGGSGGTSEGSQNNGQATELGQPDDAEQTLDSEQAEANQPTSDTNPIVTIEMDNGDIIRAELFPEIAPMSVRNFIHLINAGFYDGVIFHRVIPGFMIQGGDPNGLGTGGPGYAITGEFTANGFENNLIHERGVLSMARTGDPNSAGSQFFLMHEDSPHLDGQYAAFGKVFDGIEVVDRIAATRTSAGDKPIEEQKMKKVSVETHGIEYEAPVKIQ